jgi:hypothetical protein
METGQLRFTCSGEVYRGAAISNVSPTNMGDHTISKAKKSSMWNEEKGVEGSVETDIKHSNVQEFLGENPQPRPDEGPAGDCRQVWDPRLCDITCPRGRLRCRSCSLAG